MPFSALQAENGTQLKSKAPLCRRRIETYDANAHLQTELTARQAALQTQYDNAYNRYLAQFTQLQSLQSQMNGTTSMFDAMFSKSNS